MDRWGDVACKVIGRPEVPVGNCEDVDRKIRHINPSGSLESLDDEVIGSVTKKSL